MDWGQSSGACDKMSVTKHVPDCSPGVFGVDTEEMKSVSVMKGESITLNPDVTEAQKYLLIQWKFRSTRIAEVNRLTQTNSTYDGPDGRFRDRLQLDQTGSLTITNTRTTDSGLYQLTVTSYMDYNSVTKHVPLCSLDVTDEVKTISVMEGDPVTLHTDANKIQTYLLIQWMFGNTRIAEVGKLTQTNSTYDGPDGRFRGRLQLDQTGSLTITNTRTTDSGLYQVTVFSRETSYMSFSVMVSGIVCPKMKFCHHLFTHKLFQVCHS
uniref:Zmp:0000000652 n=1 Tax=Sinocyclocheilus anshuiensis TaxID=1608454 RepID=A0A671PGS4_9TELE